MSDLNDLKLFGHIVKDAVLKQSNFSDKKIALFTLAVNRSVKDENGNYFQEANYFPISAVVTDKMIPYLVKGQPLIIDGYLKQIKKEIGLNEFGQPLYSSKIYICTKKLQIIFQGKKNNEDILINESSQDEIIYEENEDSDDIISSELF